jgi:D-methionine transport system permease protein
MDILELLKSLGETIAMTFLSTAVAYLVGFPLGIILQITSKNGIKPNTYVNKPLGIFVNIMRSIPCLLLIVILLPVTRTIFGRGTGNWYTMLIPIIFASFGFISRIVETSLNEVDSGVIEASKSMGATTFQIIKKVLIIEAKPSLINGLTVAIINIIGLTAFAYDFGAGGLISMAYSHYVNNTRDYLNGPNIWIILIVIVLLVQIIQESGLFISKKTDKRRKSL